MKLLIPAGINKRSGTPNTVDKIRLSKEAIMEMRSSLQFYNGQFRGFNKCGKMKKELNIRDQLLLNEALCGTPIRILDKDEKLIAYSEEYNLSNFVAPTKPHIIIHDHRPLPANSCVYFYDATCFVYGNF